MNQPAMNLKFKVPDEMSDAIVAAITDAELTAGLSLLREGFAKISYRPKITCRECRERTCTVHEPERCDKCHAYVGEHDDLPFVGHAEVTARLLDVDPHWSWEPLGYTPAGLPAIVDHRNGPSEMWIKLTVCGVTRIECGVSYIGAHGSKPLVSDAIRRAAMRFGVALEMRFDGTGEDEARSLDTPSEFAAQVINEEQRNELRSIFDDITDELERNKVLDEWVAGLERPIGYTPTHRYADVYESAAAAVKAHNARPKHGSINAAKEAVRAHPKLTLKHLEAWRDTIDGAAAGVKLTKGKAAAFIALAAVLEITPAEVARRAAAMAGLSSADEVGE